MGTDEPRDQIGQPGSPGGGAGAVTKPPGESWAAKAGAIVAIITLTLTILGGVFLAGRWVGRVNELLSEPRPTPVRTGLCGEGTVPIRSFAGELEVFVCEPIREASGDSQGE